MNRITRNAVKESFDNLPSGVCFTGPGKVHLQTMTISKLATQMIPYLPFKQ